MVLGPVIRYILVSVVYPIVVPIIQKYTQLFIIRVRHGINSGNLKNQFKKMFDQTVIQSGYKYPEMTPYEAKRILDLPEGKLNFETKYILDKYYGLFLKNEMEKGGSLYLQAKIYSAKECLLEGVKGAREAEEEYVREMGLDGKREIGEEEEGGEEGKKK